MDVSLEDWWLEAALSFSLAMTTVIMTASCDDDDHNECDHDSDDHDDDHDGDYDHYDHQSWRLPSPSVFTKPP